MNTIESHILPSKQKEQHTQTDKHSQKTHNNLNEQLFPKQVVIQRSILKMQ